MRIEISARHFRASDNLKQFAEDEIMRLKKYYDGIIDCKIVFEKQRENRSCEVDLKVFGTVLNARMTTDDHFKSVVGVVDKLERQIRKYKTRMHNQRYKRDDRVLEEKAASA